MSTRQHPKKRIDPMTMPGTIGVVTGELTRFADFSVALLHLIKPEGTKLAWAKSTNITESCNKVMEHSVGEWVWMIGDDHVFDPEIIVSLLAHDVDVVVPYCLKRSAPFEPVVYSEQNEEGHYVTCDLPESGLHEIYAAGTAGMLIRRHVLDALADPIFEVEGTQNEDLVFCRKIREAGFKIYCDVDTLLGHIGLMHVWPQWQEGNGWGMELNVGDNQKIPLRRVMRGPSLTEAAA